MRQDQLWHACRQGLAGGTDAAVVDQISRGRLELVVARAAGVSAWQFVAPAMIAAFVFGTVATTIYNPISALLHERSKRLEADMLGENLSALQESTSGFWVRQKSADGAAIINASSSRDQGAQLGGVSIYTAQPTWQTGTIGGVAISTSGGKRMVPDIALTASPFNARLSASSAQARGKAAMMVSPLVDWFWTFCVFVFMKGIMP